MGNKKIENIKKASHITANILNVIKVILIVGIVLCVVGGISAACIQTDGGTTISIFGKDVTVHGVVGLDDMGKGGFDFVDDLPINNPFLRAAINCFAGAVVCGFALASVIILKNVFTTIENSETPFNENVLNKVKIAGILVTILTLAKSLGIAVMVGLSFWCVYCILDYGVELQKNEDETL